MKAEVFNAHSKYIILKHALKENNVSQTCELFGISRTTYYNWKRLYEKFGMAGLKTKEPKKPEMPNKISKSLENEILSYVERYPDDGPKRIYYELKSEGINIGESGIYNVLKRHNLTKKSQRKEYSKNKGIHSGGKRRNKKLTTAFKNIQDSYPGYLVIQRIDFIGTFEGIGKIYQYSVYDTHSKWGMVKIYNKKQDIDVWYYFELKLIYLAKILKISIDNLVTEKTKEFVPCFVKGNRYKDIIGKLNTNHSFISPGENTVLDHMTDFNELLLKEFYNKITMDKDLDSFAKVEAALHKFLRHYNFSRRISKGPNAGKVPAEIILDRAVHNDVDLDTLPLWILALINPSKAGDGNE